MFLAYLSCLLLFARVESSQPFITENNPPSNEVVYVSPGNPEEEAYRWITFRSFPVCPITNSIADLAFVGFWYTGFETRCVCFSCGNIVENWPPGIDVRTSALHLEDCRMPFQLDPDNIPLMQIFPSARSRFSRLRFSSVVQERFVRGLNLRYESQRRLSFLCWPADASVSHLELARSGFVYLGDGLSTFCFICFTIISDWNCVEGIQAAHVRLSPYCAMANGLECANIPSCEMQIPESSENMNFPNLIQSFNMQPLSDQNIQDDALLIRNRRRPVSSPYQGIAGPSYIRDDAPRMRNNSKSISSAHQGIAGPSHVWDVGPQARSRSRLFSLSHQNAARSSHIQNVAPRVMNRSRSVSSSHQDISGPSCIRGAAQQIGNTPRRVPLSHQDIAGPSNIRNVASHIPNGTRSVSSLVEDIVEPSGISENVASDRSTLRMNSEGPDSSAAVDRTMLSEIVKYVLKLGFAYDLVKKIVAKKRFLLAILLLKACHTHQ